MQSKTWKPENDSKSSSVLRLLGNLALLNVIFIALHLVKPGHGYLYLGIIFSILSVTIFLFSYNVVQVNCDAEMLRINRVNKIGDKKYLELNLKEFRNEYVITKESLRAPRCGKLKIYYNYKEFVISAIERGWDENTLKEINDFINQCRM